MPKLELTDDQASKLRTIWQSGLRRDELARAVGLTIDSLLAAKRELNLPDLRRGCRGPRREVNPTPDEISAACLEIQRGWSPEENAVRQGFPPLGDVETEAARRYKIVPVRGIVRSWER
jgi:hypothetical protein